MRSIVKTFSAAITALGLTGLGSCGSPESPQAPSIPGPDASGVVASVSVSPATHSLMVGETTTLTATARNAAGNVVSGTASSWTSSDEAVASVTVAGIVTARKPGTARIGATIAGKVGNADIIVSARPVSQLVVLPTADFVVRGIRQVQVVLLGSAGDTLTGRAITWLSSDTTVARIDTSGSVVGVGAGSAVLTATSEGRQGSSPITILPRALAVKGLYVQFEKRGWPSGYYSGEMIQSFQEIDAVVGHARSVEASEQLDVMRTMGVNTITFELRSADATFDPSLDPPPTCNVSPNLGLLWPLPPQQHLDNLAAFLTLAGEKGMKVMLRLVNTHMEDRANSQTWLGAILNRIKGHPALELVLFEGDEHLVDLDGNGTKESCGGRAEPPLWLGPTNAVAQYVQWAIGYGRGLGFPARHLSAQASVGNYNIDTEGDAGPSATGNHLWYTPRVMKMIFDQLNVPEAERTYALSLYETRRCRYALNTPCLDASPAAWADQSLLNVFSAIGFRSPARVIAVEMGVSTPVENGWNTDQALPSLVATMRNRGAEGGSLWRWTSFTDAEDANPALESPIKRRGTAYIFTSTRDVLASLYRVP